MTQFPRLPRDHFACTATWLVVLLTSIRHKAEHRARVREEDDDIQGTMRADQLLRTVLADMCFSLEIQGNRCGRDATARAIVGVAGYRRASHSLAESMICESTNDLIIPNLFADLRKPA